MSYMADVAEAEQWLTDWQARASDGAERTREMAARIAAVNTSATSRDGAVSVTVDSSGVPTDITLAPSVEGWPAGRVASQIMATMRQAQTALTHRVEEIAADTVGAGSETARTLLTPYHQRFTPDGYAEGAQR